MLLWLNILFTATPEFSIEIPDDANERWTVYFLKLFLTEEQVDNLTLETNTYTTFAVCVLFVLLLLQIGCLRQ